jgi:hypothetical protein
MLKILISFPFEYKVIHATHIYLYIKLHLGGARHGRDRKSVMEARDIS